MKNIFIALIVVLGLIVQSCSSKPSPQPASTYYAVDTAHIILVRDTTLTVRMYDPTTNTTILSHRVVSRKFDSAWFVSISPTWGQSFGFAFRTGYKLLLGIAIALFTLGLIIIVADQYDALDKVLFFLKLKSPLNPVFIKIVGFLLIVIGAVIGYDQPGTIHANNTKGGITLEHFVQVKDKDGLPTFLWDSLYQHNLIVGAGHK